jgi:hypothetical protein
VFESDFVDVQYLGKDIPQDVVGNRELSRKLRPKIRVAGETVPHFVANGPVPGHFTEAVINSSTGPVRLGLKIHPDDMPAAASRGCEVVIEKDIRLPALVSLLKAAHLTLFQMLGYRYALSAGGHFLGRTVLGDFFLANRDNPRQKVLENARSHFLEFVNMARPVLTAPTESQGTLSDGFVFVCRCDDDAPWAFIVFHKNLKFPSCGGCSNT